MWWVKQMLPYYEFVEQIAFHRQFPWGDDWQQAGVVAYASASPHVKSRLKPEDFMPKPRRPAQTTEQIMSVMRGLREAQEAARVK